LAYLLDFLYVQIGAIPRFRDPCTFLVKFSERVRMSG